MSDMIVKCIPRYLKEKKLFIGKSKAITSININAIHINVQLYYCMTEECI